MKADPILRARVWPCFWPPTLRARFLCLLGARSAVLLVITLGSACSTYHLPGQQPAPVEAPPDYTVIEPAPDASSPRPATPSVPDPNAVAAYGPLLSKAEEATARGDYELALTHLERAQRIDPDSADVYLALAKTHSARGAGADARANAERGLLYCRDETQCAQLRAYAR